MIRRTLLSLAVLAGLIAAPASAQTDQAQSGQMTANESKHVGDWLVRCFPVKSITPCDMIYVLALKKSGMMLLSMRIAYAPSQDKDLFIIGVPLQVSFAKGLVVSTDAGATAPMQYQHCDRAGCYVQSVMDNATLDQIARSQAAKTKITFAAISGKVVTLPFPLNGFAEARDTLVQLAKGRAVAPPAKAKP
ncbi:MAG: invasion associated locus B family protein [Alphaproteobacteria bacterium]|nr:invasion associated locus B family protein [Alphaproteobacteria bacterium]